MAQQVRTFSKRSNELRNISPDCNVALITRKCSAHYFLDELIDHSGHIILKKKIVETVKPKDIQFTHIYDKDNHKNLYKVGIFYLLQKLNQFTKQLEHKVDQLIT